jgi:hypothetical protein
VVKKLVGALLTLATIGTVLVLLVLVSSSLSVAQQDIGEEPVQGGDSASNVPSDGTDSTSGDAGLLEYASNISGDAEDSQAIPVCPEPAAPGTARCHSLVVADTPNSP